MKYTSEPCPCGHERCRHVILQPICVRMRKEEADEIIEAVNGYADMKDKLEQAEATAKAANAMRPHWAKGYSADSVAAQCTAAAINEIWGELKSSDQTDAMTTLKALKEAGEQLIKQGNLCDYKDGEDHKLIHNKWFLFLSQVINKIK